MLMSELRPGLRRWTAEHPDAPADGWTSDDGVHWGRDVGCVYLETTDALVLIDPLAPPRGTAEATSFWRTLDEDTARIGGSPDILLTLASEWLSHVRSAPEVRERYSDSRLWAPIGAKEEMLKRTTAVTDWFAPGDELPGGIRAFGTAFRGEVVLWLPEQRALVPADVINGGPDNTLVLLPDEWLDEGVTPQRHRDALRPLLELPIEMVLVSHGEPVLSNGHAALARALVV